MLIITGSGRSGTSAVAKLIHNGGMPVGRDLIPPDSGNADGYYEERPVVELNDRILRAAGLTEWFSTATRAHIIHAGAEIAEEMRALAAAATPAWKDPRFCWTLEAWLPYFADRPRIVVCLRSPDEVVASAMHYYGQESAEAARSLQHLWQCQYERLLEVIDEYSLDAVVVEYAALHRNPKRATGPLSRFIGLSLRPADIRRDLRHHEAGVPAHLRALYRRVHALGRRTVTSPFRTPEAPAAPSASGP